MKKVLPENSFPLPRNRRKPKRFNSVMTSMTMSTQSQTSYGFRQS